MSLRLDRLAEWIERLHGTPLEGAVGLVARVLAGKDPIRLLRVLCLTAFCAPALWSQASWASLVNHRLMILIHEGGHGLFMGMNGWWPVGRFVCIAAGSGAQIAVPLLFMAAVYSVGKRFDASLMGLWLGVNFLDVAVYAADAQARAMPLILNLGPEAHDWGNMLSMLNLLWATPVVAGLIWLGGLGAITGAVVCGVATAAPD